MGDDIDRIYCLKACEAILSNTLRTEDKFVVSIYSNIERILAYLLLCYTFKRPNSPTFLKNGLLHLHRRRDGSRASVKFQS